MINESGQSFASLKIPLNVHSMSTAKATQTSDLTRRTNSHSLAFMLRFDNNLLNFSKSYGLCDNNKNKETTNINNNGSDSYVHLLTLKFGSSNGDAAAVNSCFELWLNPAGSILFLRRTDRVILFTLNLMQVDSNVWQFVHVSYEEIETAGSNKIMCNLSYSLNASELFYKEFEIQAHVSNPLYKNTKSSEAEFNGNNHIQNSCLFLGHEERKSKDTMSFLFHYDLGQVVLSKDAAYSLEHLLILMHVMDTNVSQLDCLAKYEWAYMNGYSKPVHVENLQKDFQELANQIKVTYLFLDFI